MDAQKRLTTYLEEQAKLMCKLKYIKDYVLHQDQGGVTGVWDTTRLGVFNDM